MAMKKKFKFDIELLMILVFTLLVFHVSFSLLSPIINFIFSVFNFSAVNIVYEFAFNVRPEDQKFSVIFFIILFLVSIFIFVKLKNRRDNY